MGAAKLLTAAGGGITLDAASTATDKTITIPADNGTLVYANSSGNVGIGTGSPSTKLHVAGNITVNDGQQYCFGSNNYNGMTGSAASNIVQFYTNNAERMRIDASGSVGVGGILNSWGSNKAFQINSIAVLASDGAATWLANNWYLDSGVDKYISTAATTIYRQAAGLHQWYNAPSGTAGSAVSFTERMRLDSSGNLLVGTTNASPAVGLGVKLINSGAVYVINSAGDSFDYYNTTAGAYRFYVSSAGQIYATSTSISAISDQRLKENVRDLDTGLDSIMALQPRRFDWKEGKGQDKKYVAGFIAQEFETVFPECVSTSKAGEDGIEYKNISHETLIPTLVKAIQELAAAAQEQQAIITSLTARIEALENQQ